jgi:hypothetical protein
MIRKLKVLSLASVAVFAMGMMTASAASALTFTSEAGAEIKGEEVGNVLLTVTGREVKCADSSYAGTAPAASFTALTMTPTYRECEALGISQSVTGFGAGECNYLLHSNGEFDLVCAAGKEVTMTWGTCVTHIPAQNGLGTITYDTAESNGIKHLTLTLNITKIKETHTDGFLCPFESGGTTESAVLEGTVTAKAFFGGNQVNLTDH